MCSAIAIIGRPNVGKSTLFNSLIGSRQAIVADSAGLTRDRHYGYMRILDKRYLLIDTGGYDLDKAELNSYVLEQSDQAIKESSLVLLVVDGKSGLCGEDNVLVEHLRKFNKPVILVINKIDHSSYEKSNYSDFYSFGFENILEISASHKQGISELTDKISFLLDAYDEPIIDENDTTIRVAIAGRPNVGKSTLINRIVGENRVIASNIPGTTRDSIEIETSKDGIKYTLVDTAGLRRKGKIIEEVEKYSVIRTLSAIEKSNVVIVLFDATEGITEQDLHLLDFVISEGKSLVLAVNKWDGLTIEQKDKVRSDIDRRLHFVKFATVHFISALKGSEVGNLFPSVNKALQAARQDISTANLTRELKQAVFLHQPPMNQGRRIKLRYAHLGGKNPPNIIIHGNQADKTPDNYKRYLISYFREKFNFVGTPIRLSFKKSDNPFADKKNKLTSRQLRKRKRLISHNRK